MTEEERQIQARCSQFLSHHRSANPRQTLAALTAHEAAAELADAYGEGGAVARLEERGSALLGKDKGLFFIKGVTAQLCVLSACAAQRGCRTVALHPLSHLDFDEQNGIERVAQLIAIRVGRDAPFTVEALDLIAEPLAAVVVELPLRRAGYLLPELKGLEAIATWCREREVPLHFDGARIWEAAASYDIQLTDLASLADSVYVSFYKGLGGIGGALVAGSEKFLDTLRPWKTRFGGDLVTAYPQAISALVGLEQQLPRMPEYVARARALAVQLSNTPKLLLHPSQPQVNAFQIWIAGEPDELVARHRVFAEQRGVWLFNSFQPAALSGFMMAEIVIGDASDTYTIEQATDWVQAFAGG